MEKQFTFEKLEAWKSAKNLARQVYLISERFPASELYGLRSQMTRAAVSVAANLAEGTSRMSPKDQAHFSQLAYSSLMELACLGTICFEIGLLSSESQSALRKEIESLSRQISGLRNSQLRRINSKPSTID